MRSAVEDPRNGRTSQANAAMCLGKDIKEAAKWLEKGVQDAKAAISETLDDRVTAARRSLKRSRYAVEDRLEEAERAIKRHPFRSVAIVFAAGAAVGLIAPRIGRK